LECVRLAGAFGRFEARESGSKLPHSKRFALACVIPNKFNNPELFTSEQGAGREVCPTSEHLRPMNPRPEPLSDNAGGAWQRACGPRPAEWLAVAGLLLSFWGFHAATYNWYPAAWCDEVSYSEPGINLAQHRGFTTSALQYQPSGTFWAANPPLYGLLLSGWLRLTGASLLGVRSFNFTLFAAAAFLLWVATWRFKLVRLAPVRMGLIALMELGYGISLASRSARPDVLGMLCLVMLFLAFSIRNPRRRGLTLLLLATVTPWIGLQVALYAALASVIGWAAHRTVAFSDLLCVGLGLAAGACLLTGFLAWHHALAHFQLAVRTVTQVGGPSRLGNAAASYFKDFSSVPLILALGYFLVRRYSVLAAQARRIILSFGFLYFAVPFVFCLSADFRAYYAYMIYLPLLLAFGHACSESETLGPPNRPAPDRLVFLAAGAAAIILGLPLRLSLTAAFCQVAPRAELMNIVASRVHADDVVFSEYFTFFESKMITPHVYVPFSAKGLSPICASGLELTQEERRRVNVIIVKLDQKDSIAGYFGGKWMAVAGPFGDSVAMGKLARIPVFGRILQTLFYHAPTARFPVQIFRRVPETNRGLKSKRPLE
jgi:hypothetical protein